ncbi:centromere protein F-like isoform X2 [Rhinatrema bivittatum]|nr:centromere protein F-like isoform X2 [Rhinatrema bivittatum]XP_029470655.1 centromere protein F-like isoform X2 [Rhinatrema bivittatum]
MSWMAEEWKVGIPSQALQKLHESEKQLEKLAKERQQKQVLLEALETTLQKENQKHDEERRELLTVRQEKQILAEACSSGEKTQQQLAQELQMKDTQVCCLQGQLDSAQSQIEKLEQELNRCRIELEKLQCAMQSGESQLFLTPSWSYKGSPIPIGEGSYSSQPDLTKKSFSTGQHQTDVLLPLLSITQELQFSSSPIESRHQREPPAFPWYEESTLIQHQALSKKNSPQSPSSWEQKAPTTRNTRPQQHNGNNTACKSSKDRKVVRPEEQLRQANEVLKRTLAEMETWVQVQEKEGQIYCKRPKDFQRQSEKTRGKLAAQEQNLTKCQDELACKAAQLDQAEAKGASLEQRVRQLEKELQRWRQNAETSQCNIDQRLKMKEKETEPVQEVFGHQRLCQALERQHQQECSRLKQELQQAKSEACSLQAQLDMYQSMEEMRGALREADREIQSKRQNAELPGDLQRNFKMQETSVEETGSQKSDEMSKTHYYRFISQGECPERQKEQATFCVRKKFGPQMTMGFQRESLSRDHEMEEKSKEASRSSSVSEISLKLAEDVSRNDGITQHEKTWQSAGMHAEVRQPGPKDAYGEGKGEDLFWTGVAANEDSFQSSDGPEQLVLYDLQVIAEGLTMEKPALQSEPLDSAVAGLDSQPKDILEIGWEQKQTANRYFVAAKDLKRQAMSLEGRMSGCEMEFKSIRNKGVIWQEMSQVSEEEHRRLSKLLQGKEAVIQQRDRDMKALEMKLQQEMTIQSKILNSQDIETPKGKKMEDTPEKPFQLDWKALSLQEDHCGSILDHRDYEIQALPNKLVGPEERLKNESFDEKPECLGIVSKEPESNGTHTCAEEAVQKPREELKVLCEALGVGQARELQCRLDKEDTTVSLQTQPILLTLETKSQNREALLMSLEEKESCIVILNEMVAKAHTCLASLQAETLEIHEQLSCYSDLQGEEKPDAMLEEYAVLSTRKVASDNCNYTKEESHRQAAKSESAGYMDSREASTVGTKGYSSTHKDTAGTRSAAELQSLQEMVMGIKGVTKNQKPAADPEVSQIYIPNEKQPRRDSQEEMVGEKGRRDLQKSLKEILEKVLEAEFSGLQSPEMDAQKAGQTATVLSFLQQFTAIHARVSDILEGKRWHEEPELGERQHCGKGDGGIFPGGNPNVLRSQDIMKSELLLQEPDKLEEESLRKCDGDFNKFHVCDPRTTESVQGNSQLQCLISQLQGPGSIDSDSQFQNYPEFVKSYRALEVINKALCNKLTILHRELLQLKARAGQERDMQHSGTQTDPEEIPVNLQERKGNADGWDLQARLWTGDPTNIADRIRKQREQMSLVYDDTEYEPYGLPEVVRKGFADIPTGPACPYVLRRGLLGSSVVTKGQHVAQNGSSSGV